jgi:putative membrane protein
MEAERREQVDPSTEMSMRRTGMSFQRTRLSAERTLMSVLRTSLSLISFGFTIYQVFQKAAEKHILSGSAPARNFGVALILLGIAVLVIGAVFHIRFMAGLRAERDAMKADGLIHGESAYPPSTTLFAVALVLLLGVMAILNIAYGFGPFG